MAKEDEMVKFRIECYTVDEDCQLTNVLNYDFRQYTEWLMRAANRDYKVDRAVGPNMWVHSGRGCRNFLVKMEEDK